MTVLEVLKSACLYLDVLEEYKNYFNSTTTQLTENQQNYISKLLHAFNLVVKDISSGYVNVKTKEQVELENNTFNLTNLTKSLHKVLNVYQNGIRKKFKIFETNLVTEFSGKAEIEYSYYPQDLTIKDDFNIFNGKVSIKTLALGVASEVNFISSNFEEAKIWEERFNNNLKYDLKDSINFKLPSKRWF